MHFAHPSAFLFLLAVPFVARFWLKKSALPAIKLTFPFPIKTATTGLKSLPLPPIQTVLKILALVCCIVAIARPQTVSKSQERKANGIDIMMLLDVSLSMLIQDMGDRSRNEIAKQTFKEFIEGRRNDRIGFIIFSGEPITLAPPTLDYGLLLQQLKTADPGGGGLKDGTAIGDGLALAINRLKKSTAKSRIVILLTDGDNNVGRIDPLTAGDLAAGYGIRVYSIAIGTEGRVRQPLPQQTPLGITYNYVWVDNRLNPELLQQISEKTNGKFWRVQDEKTLQEVFKTIDQLEKTDIETKDKFHYTEEFMNWVLAAITLLIIERLFSVVAWRQWA